MYIEIFCFWKNITTNYLCILELNQLNQQVVFLTAYILFFMKLAFNFRLKGATDKIAF